MSLDGITRGDGSHLMGQTITLKSSDWQQVAIKDGDTDFDDNDHNQRLDGPQTIDGTTYGRNTRVEAEYRLTVEDSDGNTYEVLAFNVDNSSPAYGTVEGRAFVGPPRPAPSARCSKDGNRRSWPDRLGTRAVSDGETAAKRRRRRRTTGRTALPGGAASHQRPLARRRVSHRSHSRDCVSMLVPAAGVEPAAP